MPVRSIHHQDLAIQVSGMELKANEIAQKLKQDLTDGVEKALSSLKETANETCSLISKAAEDATKSAQTAFHNIEEVSRNLTNNGLASINELKNYVEEKMEAAAQLADQILESGDGSIQKINAAEENAQ